MPDRCSEKQFRLKKSQRVRQSSDFSRAFQASNKRPNLKIHSRYFVVPTFFVPDDKSHGLDVKHQPERTEVRLGVVVSKKVSKRAVDRNRIKRIIRESFRQISLPTMPLDVIIVAKWKAKTATNKQLSDDLDQVWQQLLKQMISQS